MNTHGETITTSNQDVDEVVDVEVHTHGGNEWIYDDYPCSGPIFNELSQETRDLITWAITRRSVAIYDVSYFVYCRDTATWEQMHSSTAAHELCSVIGVNAPVNYFTALERYYPTVTRLAFPVGKLERSVCINTWRLTYTVSYVNDGPVVTMDMHRTVIDNPRGDEHRRMYMFVNSPLLMPFPFEIPRRIMIDMDNEMMFEILRPLRDDQKRDFMWRIGKILTDGERWPTVIILYGKEGHEGKGEFSKNITRLLTSLVEWTTIDLVGKKSKWPGAKDVMKLASKRIIICDECNIEEGMNNDNVKRWTSDSPVQSDGMSAYLSQIVIGLTNTMGFAKRDTINNSMGRRVMVYKMDKRMGDYKAFPKDRIDNWIRMQFVSLALWYAAEFKYPPVSLEMALETIFKRSVNYVTAGLRIEPTASPSSCVVATAVMAIRSGVTIARLTSTFAAMSKRLVTTCKPGLSYVNGMSYTKYTLTKAGEDYVYRNWGRTTVDLDTLKEEVRLI
jgi:hypothetical protein